MGECRFIIMGSRIFLKIEREKPVQDSFSSPGVCTPESELGVLAHGPIGVFTCPGAGVQS